MAGRQIIDFDTWRNAFRRALDLGETTDIPCDGCTACCRSAQFVHIEADETATLRRIPPGLLAPAPGGPPGQLVMGYDRDGCCPMLGDEGCRIYEDRPRACRTYDCRVFAATAVTPDQPLVAEQLGRWEFGATSAREAARQTATDLQVAGAGPTEAALQAVLAES